VTGRGDRQLGAPAAIDRAPSHWDRRRAEAAGALRPPAHWSRRRT